MVKSYFDGGNQADSALYRVLTLAAFCGNAEQWGRFDREWNLRLKKHGADFLHATDALSLQKTFGNWTNSSTQALIEDCVSVIEKHAPIPYKRTGLMPVTVSVILPDFIEALKKVPTLGTPEHTCAVQCASLCFEYGERYLKSDQYQLFFDQGERFCGHLRDRKLNKKSVRHDAIWKKVGLLAEADMRITPGLQAADLLAWAATQALEDKPIRHDWQYRMLDVYREKELYDLQQLTQPKHDVIQTVLGWNLPPRRRPR